MVMKIAAQVFLALALAFSPSKVSAQNAGAPMKFRLESIDELEIHSAKLDAVEVPNASEEIASYLGRRAVKLVNRAGVTSAGQPANGETITILKGSDFSDGTIEAEVVGVPRAGAQAGVRGFVGIAFRVGPHGSKYECISLRQTNGRADDQLRRNHTTQYSAYPEFPWHRLRAESPGVYESYVDVEPGAWTKVKIVVSGTKARLYVNGSDQPCLIVNDLKLGDSNGQIALWAGTDTEAYFSDLTIAKTK
jgi:hypothetical protein